MYGFVSIYIWCIYVDQSIPLDTVRALSGQQGGRAVFATATWGRPHGIRSMDRIDPKSMNSFVRSPTCTSERSCGAMNRRNSRAIELSSYFPCSIIRWKGRSGWDQTDHLRKKAMPHERTEVRSLREGRSCFHSKASFATTVRQVLRAFSQSIRFFPVNSCQWRGRPFMHL